MTLGLLHLYHALTMINWVPADDTGHAYILWSSAPWHQIIHNVEPGGGYRSTNCSPTCVPSPTPLCCNVPLNYRALCNVETYESVWEKNNYFLVQCEQSVQPLPNGFQGWKINSTRYSRCCQVDGSVQVRRRIRSGINQRLNIPFENLKCGEPKCLRDTSRWQRNGRGCLDF